MNGAKPGKCERTNNIEKTSKERVEGPIAGWRYKKRGGGKYTWEEKKT